MSGFMKDIRQYGGKVDLSQYSLWVEGNLISSPIGIGFSGSVKYEVPEVLASD
jgi:hypothetical protein